MWPSMHFDVRVVGAPSAGSWKVDRATSSGAGFCGSCLWGTLVCGNTSSTFMMPRMMVTLSAVVEPKIAVMASLKISSVLVVGVCWKMLEPWEWKVLFGDLGMGLWKGLLVGFLRRGCPVGVFVVAFVMPVMVGRGGKAWEGQGKIFLIR